jgi:hypothetical protein
MNAKDMQLCGMGGGGRVLKPMRTCTKCVIKMLRFKINIPCMVCQPTDTQTRTSCLQINMYREVDAVINY